jgi:YbbR domain-containing protein
MRSSGQEKLVFERILRAFTYNWALKLAGLTLAILLWLAVRATDPRESTIPIPVQVDLRDPNWQLAAGPQPEAVHVTVQGPIGELLTLAGQPPRIVLPVERVADSVEVQVIPIQWVQLPRGLRQARVLTVRPDTVRLHYERLATRTLPVRVQTRGRPNADYQLVPPITTNPGFVQVRGPLRLLTGMDSVPLVPVDISGLRSTTNIPARVDSAAMGPVRVMPAEVNVVVRVAPVDPEEPPADGSPDGPR